MQQRLSWPAAAAIAAGLWLTTGATGLAAVNAACDQSLQSAFNGDPETTITAVKFFPQGADLNLDGHASGKLASADLCMVKLMVGPGHKGPADAPSTSRGIGIEVWLPSRAHWNGRIHVLGGGGYQGLPQISSLTELNAFVPGSAADIAMREGAVSAVTDTGHAVQNAQLSLMDGSFGMNPDGSVNTALWRDFSSRAMHETALKTKALTRAYLGRTATHAYFDGCSTGGRQGSQEAQMYPEDFDGILIGSQAINWTRFQTAEMYPQIVMQRDLHGVPLTPAQLQLVSSAAVSACDTDLTGHHEGYISRPAACPYDPVHDSNVLCRADGGTSTSSACVSPTQALAIDKIWYGLTRDGSVPDPKQSNGYDASLGPTQLWFGPARGTALANPPFPLGLANSMNGMPSPFPIGSSQLAYDLKDASYASPPFHNASRPFTEAWKSMSYAELARAFETGASQNAAFGHINTDNADLSALRAHHSKVIDYYGMADQLIMIEGSMRYYEQVAKRMGGYDAVQQFFRFYPVPGLGHCFGVGSVDGLAGVSPKADPPLPAPGQLYGAVVRWVEQGQAPDDLTIRNARGSVTHPLCMYPKQLSYSGGATDQVSSYTCR